MLQKRVAKKYRHGDGIGKKILHITIRTNKAIN